MRTRNACCGECRQSPPIHRPSSCQADNTATAHRPRRVAASYTGRPNSDARAQVTAIQFEKIDAGLRSAFFKCPKFLWPCIETGSIFPKETRPAITTPAGSTTWTPTAVSRVLAGLKQALVQASQSGLAYCRAGSITPRNSISEMSASSANLTHSSRNRSVNVAMP